MLLSECHLIRAYFTTGNFNTGNIIIIVATAAAVKIRGLSIFFVHPLPLLSRPGNCCLG
jgi:hypothetical protein